MADIKNQQRLETNAIEKRQELVIKNKYKRGEGESDTIHQYNEQHPDALSNGDPLGKGTGKSMTAAPNPGVMKTRAISYTNIDTHNGGGSYDIDGREPVGGGRNWSMTRNLYNMDGEYGPESVDMTENIRQGQVNW